MTILREAEHRALKGYPLKGEVLDLGGDARSEYRSLFSGTFSVTTVNILPEAQPDIVADLEKPLPIADGAYDAVLLINVLEHIFEYRALLAECARVLRPGGTIVIVVPFLFPYHPSPNDFHRYTREALSRALSVVGFATAAVTPLGSGVVSARVVLTERLLPGSVQNILGVFIHPCARILDSLIGAVARILRKKYDAGDYALGFFVTATKSV
jgi:SAM-dependent methyltransferase